jgi:hypothetical protein
MIEPAILTASWQWGQRTFSARFGCRFTTCRPSTLSAKTMPIERHRR